MGKKIDIVYYGIILGFLAIVFYSYMLVQSKGSFMIVSEPVFAIWVAETSILLFAIYLTIVKMSRIITWKRDA